MAHTNSTNKDAQKSHSNKVLTIILDGWGLNKNYEGNAIARANTPFFDEIWANEPHATFKASGESVGLPEGQMGTSEVNHLTIGAGRVIYQDLVRINKAIADKSLFKNKVLQQTFQHAVSNNSAVHIMGLVSDGGVHSHLNHIKALVTAAKQAHISKLYIHAFTDGRDTLPHSGEKYILDLQNHLDEIGLGRIVTVAGRYYAMDRDHNWERTDKAFKVLTQPTSADYSSALDAIKDSYQNNITDEFIEPVHIQANSPEEGIIKENDAVIFANFRNDRPRQLTERFIESDISNLHFVTMTRYNPNYPVKEIFAPFEKITSLGEILSQNDIKQLRITETEKFAHLTFFLNCKHEDPFPGEDRFMFDSYSDIKTHDERPEMRAPDIAKHIVQDIEEELHQVIFTNICNTDMVGHTGNIEAAIKAAEAADKALATIIPVALKHDYHVIVTADHGNSDEMIDEQSGEVLTSHSLNPVPFILLSPTKIKLNKSEGTLIDIAPTILDILDIDQPSDMTGHSLIA